MANELSIINNTVFSGEELDTINRNIDGMLANNANNRSFVNQLAFLCSHILAAGSDFEGQMADKLRHSMLWGNVYGTDRDLRDKILGNSIAAKYVAQLALQKLSSQNLMSFDLITALSNMLNASVFKINKEFQDVNANLTSFFKHNRNELVRMETRMDKAERNINLLTWQTSIEYQEWDGKEYIDMRPEEKIVCLVRDFYEITKGTWSTSDLLLLKAAMGTIDLHFKDRLNFFAFLQSVAYNEKLKNKLLGGKKLKKPEVQEMLLSMTNLKKIESYTNEDHYLVESVKEILEDNRVRLNDKQLTEQLTLKYMAKEVHVNMNVEIELYDLCLELLFNLQQAEAMGVLTADEESVSEDGPELPYPLEKPEVEEKIEQIVEDCVADYQFAEFLDVPAKRSNKKYSLDDVVRKADSYYKGKEREQDYKQAKALYEQAAAAGNGNANLMLGQMAELGHGMNKDLTLARKYYVEAGGQGEIDAYRRIGDLFYKEKYIKKAINNYVIAISKGSLGACYSLVAICANPATRDNAKVEYALHSAINLGDIDAYEKLYYYYADKKMGNDFKQACDVLDAGIANGSNACRYRKGMLYYTGVLTLDYEKAFELFKCAYDNNFATRNMLITMGKMFEKGQGVDRNTSEAFEYYKLVADKTNDVEACLRIINTYTYYSEQVKKWLRCLRKVDQSLADRIFNAYNKNNTWKSVVRERLSDYENGTIIPQDTIVWSNKITKMAPKNTPVQSYNRQLQSTSNIDDLIQSPFLGFFGKTR